MGAELRGKVDAATSGSTWSLVLVGVFAVGREGLETALFLWAATQAGTGLHRRGRAHRRRCSEPRSGSAPPSSLAGCSTAVRCAINLSSFFAWTGGFLILVAAGVLAYGIHDLQEGGFLPGVTDVAFDVSGTIVPGTWYATVLKGVLNFSPVTTRLEAVAWVLYAVPVMVLFVLGVRRRQAAVAPAGAARLRRTAVVVRAAARAGSVGRVQTTARPARRSPSRGRSR